MVHVYITYVTGFYPRMKLCLPYLLKIQVFKYIAACVYAKGVAILNYYTNTDTDMDTDHYAIFSLYTPCGHSVHTQN